MEQDKKRLIVEYLSGPRLYDEGAALYSRFGANRMLKRRFSIEQTEFTKSLLLEELRKLAGLSEREFQLLPRRAKVSELKPAEKVGQRRMESSTEQELIELADRLGVSVDELTSDEFCERVQAMDEYEGRIEELEEEVEVARKKYREAPEPVKKMIRFRERYPFLSSRDCPDMLKILVADMFSAYETYRQAHARLLELPDGAVDEAAKIAEEVVESYLDNREMWEELDYYRDNGKILGKAKVMRAAEAEKALAELSDMELASKLSSARSNYSKRLKASEADASEKALEALNKWRETKDALEEEMRRRKKK